MNKPCVITCSFAILQVEVVRVAWGSVLIITDPRLDYTKANMSRNGQSLRKEQYGRSAMCVKYQRLKLGSLGIMEDMKYLRACPIC